MEAIYSLNASSKGISTAGTEEFPKSHFASVSTPSVPSSHSDPFGSLLSLPFHCLCCAQRCTVQGRKAYSLSHTTTHITLSPRQMLGLFFILQVSVGGLGESPCTSPVTLTHSKTQHLVFTSLPWSFPASLLSLKQCLGNAFSPAGLLYITRGVCQLTLPC